MLDMQVSGRYVTAVLTNYVRQTARTMETAIDAC